MPDNITDISEQSWDDLTSTDHGILRELAGERDGVNGNGSTEQIAAQLLAHGGRDDEVPEEHRHHIDGDGDEGQDDGEEDEPDEESTEFETASQHEPSREATFIIEASVMQGWLEYVDTLVDEAKVHLTPTGLRIRAVDPANVGMVDTSLDPEAFESFNVPGEGVVGVNIKRLAAVLDGADAGDIVEIDYDAETRHLIISYGGHQFSLALIDPASIRKEPDLPDLDLPGRVVYPDAKDFTDSIGFAESVTDHVRLSIEPDERVFEVYGEGDTDDYSGRFEDGEEIDLVRVPDEVKRSLYSLDYMTDIVKPISKGQELTIDIGQEFPTRLSLDVEHDDETVGAVVFMLAPRIQSE